MEQSLTVAELEQTIEWADKQLEGIPHGNAILTEGESRPMTVRDQFAPVLESLRRQGYRGRIRIDMNQFLDYWRNCILDLNPPAFRPISAERLKKKGNHLIARTIQCAVTRRHSSAGANPARQLSFQPVAVGADDGGNDIG